MKPMPQTEELSEQDEEVLLEELGEVAHMNEDSGEIVVFAPPSEVHAIGVNTITLIGGWLLERRKNRRAKAASSAGDSSISEALTVN